MKRTALNRPRKNGAEKAGEEEMEPEEIEL